MSVTTLEAKAHELLGQLEPAKLAAVVQLLEAMVDDKEPISEEDRSRLRKSQEPGVSWVSMDDMLAEYGLTIADFPLNK